MKRLHVRVGLVPRLIVLRVGWHPADFGSQPVAWTDFSLS